MNKKHIEICFDAYTSLEEAVAILQEYDSRGELVCGTFNGHVLYSDKMDIDSAYFELFGKSKADFEKAKQECLENVKQEHAKYEAKLLELMHMWIAKGQDVLEEKYWHKWVNLLNQSNPLYENLPEQCLEIVSALNGGCSLQEAKKLLEGQAHSGASLGLVLEMAKQVSDRGAELADLF